MHETKFQSLFFRRVVGSERKVAIDNRIQGRTAKGRVAKLQFPTAVVNTSAR
jgi:hypothetical protein